ncbi:MAG TPA: DUF3822 family protein, partial [Chitinophagaceae bacterium]|nr:DUF3822 family protein [Chitinophagaceae bacterium]
HIKPENGYNPANSILLMVAGKRHCTFAVMNYLSKELVEFGYYISNDDEVDYKRFFEESEVLNTRYYQAAIAYDADEIIQIPSAVYKYEDGPLHLDAVYGKNIHTTVVSEKVPGWNFHNIYRLPTSLQSTVSWKFLSGKFWNIYSVFLKNYPNTNGDVIHVNFKTDEFSVVILKDNSLQLAKTFAYSSPEDVLYYLLKACRQFHLSQQTCRLNLSGLIEKDSAVYRELYKYFVSVEFESLAGEIKLAGSLTTHPDHYFSSISKLAACVL